MPSAPFFLRASLHFSSITSKACFQEIAWNLPFLSYLPSVMRNMGVVRRSLPYMILDRKKPLMQFRPRLTGASGSPWVATTRPFWVPTRTLQPTPQKRHGALFH